MTDFYVKMDVAAKRFTRRGGKPGRSSRGTKPQYAKELEGAIGEVAFEKWSGLPLDIYNDTGADFWFGGNSIDAKASDYMGGRIFLPAHTISDNDGRVYYTHDNACDVFCMTYIQTVCSKDEVQHGTWSPTVAHERLMKTVSPVWLKGWIYKEQLMIPDNLDNHNNKGMSWLYDGPLRNIHDLFPTLRQTTLW